MQWVSLLLYILWFLKIYEIKKKYVVPVGTLLRILKGKKSPEKAYELVLCDQRSRVQIPVAGAQPSHIFPAGRTL